MSNVDISLYVVIHHVVSIAKDERSLIPGFVFLFLRFLPAEGEDKRILHDKCFCFTFLLVRISKHFSILG